MIREILDDVEYLKVVSEKTIRKKVNTKVFLFILL